MPPTPHHPSTTKRALTHNWGWVEWNLVGEVPRAHTERNTPSKQYTEATRPTQSRLEYSDAVGAQGPGHFCVSLMRPVQTKPWFEETSGIPANVLR
jgi:hypothetical protein